MTSIIKVDEIQNKAGSTSLAANKLPDMHTGSAKAWASINQDGTGHPTYDSFNISSTSDRATGKTDITFSSAMDNADYATAGTAQTDGESGGYFGVSGKSGAGSDPKMTTSTFAIDNRIGTDASNRDLVYMSFTIHGDLA